MECERKPALAWTGDIWDEVNVNCSLRCWNIWNGELRCEFSSTWPVQWIEPVAVWVGYRNYECFMLLMDCMHSMDGGIQCRSKIYAACDSVLLMDCFCDVEQSSRPNIVIYFTEVPFYFFYVHFIFCTHILCNLIEYNSIFCKMLLKLFYFRLDCRSVKLFTEPLCIGCVY